MTLTAAELEEKVFHKDEEEKNIEEFLEEIESSLPQLSDDETDNKPLPVTGNDDQPVASENDLLPIEMKLEPKKRTKKAKQAKEGKKNERNKKAKILDNEAQNIKLELQEDEEITLEEIKKKQNRKRKFEKEKKTKKSKSKLANLFEDPVSSRPVKNNCRHFLRPFLVKQSLKILYYVLSRKNDAHQRINDISPIVLAIRPK